MVLYAYTHLYHNGPVVKSLLPTHFNKMLEATLLQTYTSRMKLDRTEKRLGILVHIHKQLLVFLISKQSDMF